MTSLCPVDVIGLEARSRIGPHGVFSVQDETVARSGTGVGREKLVHPGPEDVRGRTELFRRLQPLPFGLGGAHARKRTPPASGTAPNGI